MQRLNLILTVVLLLTACSVTEDTDHRLTRPDFDSIPVYDLVELFRISTFHDNSFFAFISNITVGNDNTIFVGDRGLKKIFIFDREGNYKGYIGGEGEGPGEFRQLGSMFKLTPDTLVVDDTQLTRITFFSKHNQKWTLVKSITRPREVTEYGSGIFFIFNSLYPHPGGFLVRFANSFTPVDTATHNFAYYKIYDRDLNPVDDRQFLYHLVSQAAVHRIEGRSVNIMGIPEVHRTLFDITPDGRKISTWTGDTRIEIRDITGGDSTGFFFQSNRVSISAHEKTSLAEGFIPQPEFAALSVNQLKTYIPNYKGFSSSLIVDDRERIWVLTRPFEDDDPEWLIYNMNGELLAAAPHPGGSLMKVMDNRMYFRISSADEEAAMAVYEIRES